MTKTIKTSLLTLLSVIFAIVCFGAFATMPKAAYADSKPATFAEAMDTYFEDENKAFLADDAIAADYSNFVEKYSVTKALYNDAVGAGAVIDANDQANFAHLELLFDDALRLRIYMQNTLNDLVASKAISTSLEVDAVYGTQIANYATLLANPTVVGSTTLGALATEYFEEYKSIQNQTYGKNNFEVVAEVLTAINNKIADINTLVATAIADVEAGTVKLSDATTIDAAAEALLAIYDVYATKNVLASLDGIKEADIAKITNYAEYKGYYDQLVVIRNTIATLNAEIKALSNFYIDGDIKNVCYSLKFDDAARGKASKGADALREEFDALPTATDDNQAGQITNIGLLEALENAIAQVQAKIDTVVGIIALIDKDLYTLENKANIDKALAYFNGIDNSDDATLPPEEIDPELPGDVTAHDIALYEAQGTEYYVTNNAGDDYGYLKEAEAKYAEMKAQVEAFIASLEDLIVIEEAKGDVLTAVNKVEVAINPLTVEQRTAYATTERANAYVCVEKYGDGNLETYGEIYDYFAYYKNRIPANVDPVEDAIKALINRYESNDPDRVEISKEFINLFDAAAKAVEGIEGTIYEQYVTESLMTYFDKIKGEYEAAFASVDAWVDTVKALYTDDTYTTLKKLSIATDSAELVKLTTIDAVKANYEDNLQSFHAVIEDPTTAVYYDAYVAMEAAVTARTNLDNALKAIADRMAAISIVKDDIAETDTVKLEEYNTVVVNIDTDLGAFADDIINFYFELDGAIHKDAYNNFVAAKALNEVYKVEVLINKVESYPGVAPITFDTYRASIKAADDARVALDNDAAIRNLADLDAHKLDLANYVFELKAWIEDVKTIAADVDSAKALNSVNLLTVAELKETLAGFATLATWNGVALNADSTIIDSALLTEAKEILAQIETTAWKLITDLTARIDAVVLADLNADADEIAAINNAYEALDDTQKDVANDDAIGSIQNLLDAKASLVTLEAKIAKLKYFIAAIADINKDVCENKNYTVENAIMYNVLSTIFTNYEEDYQNYLVNNGHKALLDAVAAELKDKDLLDLTSVNEELANAIKDIVALQGDVSDLKAELDKLTKVDGVIDNINSQLDDVNDTLDKLVNETIKKLGEDIANGDKTLQDAIDGLTNDLADAKKTIKEEYEAAIDDAVSALEEAYKLADSNLKKELEDAYKLADSNLKKEIEDAYKLADKELKEAYDILIKALQDKDVEIDDAIAALQAKDGEIDQTIADLEKALTDLINKEVADREAADKALEEKLMAEIKTLNTKLVVASVILSVFTAALIGAAIYIFLVMFKKNKGKNN